jgi:hypothetical protein
MKSNFSLEEFKNYCKSIQTNPGLYEGTNPGVELANLESDFYGELAKLIEIIQNELDQIKKTVN